MKRGRRSVLPGFETYQSKEKLVNEHTIEKAGYIFIIAALLAVILYGVHLYLDSQNQNMKQQIVALQGTTGAFIAREDSYMSPHYIRYYLVTLSSGERVLVSRYGEGMTMVLLPPVDKPVEEGPWLPKEE